jgi:hypothetical protein
LGVEDRTRFVCSSWDPFSETGFDVVILLSALHYAKDQPALLARIATMLKPDGLFVLEAGVVANPRQNWTSVLRGKPPNTDIVEYPTTAHMFTMLSEHYSARDVGRSVFQPGDMLPRFVWHCRPLKPMILAIGGLPRQGKSTLAFSLQRSGIPILDVDAVLVREMKLGTPLGQTIAQVFELGHLDRCYHELTRVGAQQLLVDATLTALDGILPGKSTVAVMGMAFVDPNFMAAFHASASERRLVVWDVTRGV